MTSGGGALPPVCILAGGRGTRLGSLTAQVPKALIEVAGEPFLRHQIRMLEDHGVTDVVLCVGHLGGQIVDRMGDRVGPVSIRYSFDGPGGDGTLGALRRAVKDLTGDFLVMYGDTYLRLDLPRFVAEWRESGRPAGMTVLRNDGRWDRSNAHYESGVVVSYDKRHPTPGMAWIDYGLGALTPGALEAVGESRTDLADLYGALARAGDLFGFEVTERFYEIGSPQGLAETDRFMRGIRGGTTGPPRR